MLNINSTSEFEVDKRLLDFGPTPVLAQTAAALEADLVELESIEDEDVFDQRWSRLDERFPGNVLLLSARVRRLIKRKAFEDAVAVVDSYPFADTDLLVKAELLFEAREIDRSRSLYDQLLKAEPERRDVRMSYGRHLFGNGFLTHAHDVLMPLRAAFPEGAKKSDLIDRVHSLHALLTRLEGTPPPRGQDARIISMKNAILRFRNRDVRDCSDRGLGRLCLITGGLGAGGAERQLTRLAVELERARADRGSVAGIALNHPVDVLVRSYDPDRQNDFYLPDLDGAGVAVHQIDEFRPVAPKNLGIEDPDLLELLTFIPSSVNYGVKRLVDYFREARTDTVSIWQDGACLFAGLAALIAGVPHIQLAIRGLPPSMRKHMFRPEYQAFYQAMAQIPGVSFISNNVCAAHAYADWLGIPHSRFAIVYNGVEPMQSVPSDECERRWAEFEQATADAEHTIGGVFRFNTDKQPLLWIRFAARYLKHHPRTRIVLVGGGRLLPNAEKLAQDLGISDRILFVGASNRVGYWMTRMDALILLSRYEGLPNVLIEAQYMGVRVVTTPAGGAAECLVDGVTGGVLECAEDPDLDNAVALVRGLAEQSADRTIFAEGGVGRTFLDTHFSIPHMLSQYVSCTFDRLPRARMESLDPPSRRAA
ncbi:MAG TPA: glycosyltransferase [Sphingomicrobium sp.]|nr:glycosyltransferase [Sphingomicrobium sp.]